MFNFRMSQIVTATGNETFDNAFKAYNQFNSDFKAEKNPDLVNPTNTDYAVSFSAVDEDEDDLDYDDTDDYYDPYDEDEDDEDGEYDDDDDF